MKRYVLYGRHSTDLQNDKSAEDQIAICDERAKSFKDWERVGQYFDKGLSGDTMRKRTGFLALLRDATQGKFDVVVVESLDRMSRRPSDSHYIYEKLQFHDVQIYSTLDNDFLNDLHMALRSFESAQQIKKTKQNVKRGQAAAVNRGVLVGRIPYGYSVVRTTDMPRGVRAINEDEAKIVRRIFAEYAADISPIEIIRRLNEEGIKSPSGNEWRQSTLFGHQNRAGGILTNPHYKGTYRWGITETRRNPDTGAMQPRRVDPEKVKEITLPMELRVVDETVWNIVQARVAAQRRLPLPRRKLPKHVLSGLIFCGVCRNTYTVKDSKRCGCTGRAEFRTCTNSRRVDRAELETAVLALLNDTLLNPTLVDSYIKAYRAEHKRVFAEIDADASAIRKRVDKSERELERLVGLIASDETDDTARAVLLMAVPRRNEELEKLRLEGGGSKICHLPMHNAENIVLRLKSQLQNLRECLAADSAESGRARQMVRSLIDRITIYPTGEDDGRGCGPVRVEVEGRIRALLKCTDSAEGSSDRVVQLGLDTEDRLNHVTWSASTTVENSNKAQKTKAPMSTDLVLNFLGRAPAQVSTKELVDHVIQSCGLDYSDHSLHVIGARVQRCLNHLREIGAAVVAPLPGMRKYRWALAKREREFWPSGIPARVENYADTDKVMDILSKTSALMTVNEIVDQIAIASGERPRKRRINSLGYRVRGCLHFHRQQGTVLQVTYAGTKKQGWLLTSRKNELLPNGCPNPDGKIRNDASVLTILTAGSAPMTAPEIAKAILSLTGDPPTERNMESATWRVREHLRRFHAQGTVREVRIKGSRFSGWLLCSTPCRKAS